MGFFFKADEYIYACIYLKYTIGLSAWFHEIFIVEVMHYHCVQADIKKEMEFIKSWMIFQSSSGCVIFSYSCFLSFFFLSLKNFSQDAAFLTSYSPLCILPGFTSKKSTTHYSIINM